MSNPERRLAVWVTGIAGLGLLASVGPLLLAASHLPDPLATHFGLSGAPDGMLPRLAFALLLAGPVLVPAWLAWPRPHGLQLGPAAKLRMMAFMSTLSVVLGAVTLWHNWDRAVWTEARHFQLMLLLPLLGLPLLAAALVGVVARRSWPAEAASALVAEALPLGPGERAYWSGAAHNRWFLLIMAGILLQVGISGVVRWNTSAASHMGQLVQLLVLLVLEPFSRIRVSVDAQTLTIHYGHLGWIRQRIPLGRIARATAFALQPLSHGGWGYRGSLNWLGRAAVVVRAGTALRLELRDNKQFCVTVDDAETGARLINGFLQRSAETSTSSPAALVELPATR